MLADLVLSHGLHVGSTAIPWSVVVLIAIVVIGLLLIRTVITVAKVAILVGVGLAIFLLMRFLLKL